MHLCPERVSNGSRVMEDQQHILTDRVCWVALGVAVATLGLLLWMFD